MPSTPGDEAGCQMAAPEIDRFVCLLRAAGRHLDDASVFDHHAQPVLESALGEDRAVVEDASDHGRACGRFIPFP